MTSYRLDRPYLPRTSVLGRSLCVVATALPLGLLTGLAGTATGWEPVIALQALYGCAGAAWVAGIRARPRLRRVAAAVGVGLVALLLAFAACVYEILATMPPD